MTVKRARPVEDNPLAAFTLRGGWMPLLYACGMVAVGGIVARAQFVADAETMPQPEQPVMAAAPIPEPPPAAPPAEPEQPALVPGLVVPKPDEVETPRAGVRRRGGIGYVGPIDGDLSAQLPEGAVMGPQWNRKPLPAVPGSLPLIAAGPAPGPAPASVPGKPAPPAARTSDVSSELPDAAKLALSRLAHPELQVRSVETQKAEPISAERPLSLSMSVTRPASGVRAGEPVAVRLSASADCYLLLIRVDGSGKVSTLYRASIPARRFAYVVRTSLDAGPEYLVAVGSAQPLDGADVAAALRSSGKGFTLAAQEGATAPGAAWTLAVNHAAGLGGAQKSWARHEWDVATAAFVTQAPPPVKVAQKPGRQQPEKPAAAKSPEQPASPGESSTLPAPKPPEPKQESTPKPPDGSELPATK